ncbi:MAG: hypothetical protein JSS82_03275 [Bacteroidetes bacterium]|nr:hypothetical protein [Bacteroidota bacterium]
MNTFTAHAIAHTSRNEKVGVTAKVRLSDKRPVTIRAFEDGQSFAYNAPEKNTPEKQSFAPAAR